MAFGFKSGGRRKGTRNRDSIDKKVKTQKLALELLRQIRAEELITKAFLDHNGNHLKLRESNLKLLMRLIDYAWGKPTEQVELTLNVRQVVDAARNRVMALEETEEPNVEGRTN